MNFVKLSMMYSLFMGLSLISVKAMKSEGLEIEKGGFPRIVLCSSGEMATEEEPSQNSQLSQCSQRPMTHYTSNTQGYPIDSQESQSQSITKISSLQAVHEKIRALHKSGVVYEEICVVLDFHGVIVNETEHPQTFQPTLTVKEGVEDLLQYLKREGVAYFVATAWNDFDAVIKDGSRALSLPEYFGVNPDEKTEKKNYTLGPDETTLTGYQNGRFLSLKSLWSAEHFFRQKAYGVELLYPNQNFQHLFCVEDSSKNLGIFKEDSNSISHTRWKHFQEMHLYLLEDSQEKETQDS